jgi:signal transduction histidine kinase
MSLYAYNEAFMKKICFFLLCIFLSHLPILSQPILHFKNTLQPTFISQYGCLKQDINDVFTVNDAINDTNFKPIEGEHWVLGGRNNRYTWLKFNIENKEKNKAYLELMFAHIDTATLYTVDNGKVIKVQHAGQKMLKEQRALDIHNFIFVIDTSSRPLTYFLNVKLRWECKVNIRIASSRAMWTYYYHDNLIQGLFIGFILFGSLYSFCLYIYMNNYIQLHYSFFLFFCAVSIMQLNGYFIEELFRTPPQYNDLTMALPGVAIIFFLLFNMTFLQTYKRLPNMHKGFWILIAIHLLETVIALTPWQMALSVMSFVTIPIASAWSLIAAIMVWRRGSQTAIYLILALFVYNIFFAIFILDTIGLLPYNTWTSYALHIGQGAELLVLFLGIAKRYKAIEENRNQTRSEMIATLEDNKRLVDEHNQILKNKVVENEEKLHTAIQKVEKSEDVLKEYAQKLEKSNRELTEFAHIASHDLKAPIRNILSFSQLFERRNVSKFDDTDREYFNFIKNNAKHSARLIDDLLSYSKIDKNLGDPEIVDIERCLFKVQMNFQSLIKERNVHFVIKDLPILRGHESLIMQLFQNLIGNGIKYNTNEKPTITIGYDLIQETTPRFYVKDNGIGIETEHIEKVFSMFYRLHNQLEFEGTGIGLAFCSRIVNTYGGTIWLDSQIGMGSTVYFTLPHAYYEQEQRALESNYAIA